MSNEEFDDLILDYHLGRLDTARRQWLVEQLEGDETLRARSERLGAVLHPLDHWSAASGTANIADTILHYVERNVKGEAAGPLPRRSYGRGRFVPVRDLLAVAACLILLMSVMVPGLSEVRTRAQRSACEDNLRGLYLGLSAYLQMHDEALPYAGLGDSQAWLPKLDRDGGFASNSRHVFRLLKSDVGVVPNDFVCPASGRVSSLQGVDLNSFTDFASPNDVSYDTLNLAGAGPPLRPMQSIAYLGDANPLFVGGRFHSELNPDEANSPAHRGRGQNVLMLDGTARLLGTPMYGPRKDNVWTLNGVRFYTGRETTARADDAFLIPGFPTQVPTKLNDRR